VGPVEHAVRSRFSAPATLHTIGQEKPFILSAIDRDGIVLLLGGGHWHTRLTWGCLESVIPFLRSHPGWVPAGGKFSVDGEPGTLDEHLKRYLKRDVARWLARVLELAGVVELGATRPLSVRLATSYR
jgi:hypothetical protein